jgi:preprotein translocase subunit SecG
VFLYRGGDVAGAGIQGALSALGTMTLMAAATVPFAAVWCFLSIALGKAQQRRDPAQQGNQAASQSESAGAAAEAR